MEMLCSVPNLGVDCQWRSETRLACSSLLVYRIFVRTGEDARRSIVRLWRSEGGLRHDALKPGVEFAQGKFTLQSVAFLAIADLSVEGG
jgi:hypothetical protein